MFLNNLNHEEKRYFWKMINLVSECDDEVSVEEQAMLNSYKKELDIDVTEDLKMDLEELLDLLDESSDIVKKSVLIEIIALIMSDSKYDNSEKELVEIISSRFNIDEDIRKNMFEWVEKIQNLYSEANALIL
jgi:hypothetical protein